MRLGLTALLVRDYGEAIDFYCGVMGFSLVEDTDMGGGKRWVVIGGEVGGSLLLARAVGSQQLAAVGDQFGGRVGLFAYVDDFEDLAPVWKTAVRYSRSNRARRRTAGLPCYATSTATAGI